MMHHNINVFFRMPNGQCYFLVDLPMTNIPHKGESVALGAFVPEGHNNINRDMLDGIANEPLLVDHVHTEYQGGGVEIVTLTVTRYARRQTFGC